MGHDWRTSWWWPLTVRSRAWGHAITIGNPLRLTENAFVLRMPNPINARVLRPIVFKLAKFHLLTERRPDLVVSGINHGSNTAISILYSGTMSAAVEASIEGFPSIGFSLCDYALDADFSHVVPPCAEDCLYGVG